MLSFFDANCVIGRVVRPTPAMLTEPVAQLDEMRRFGISAAIACDAQAIEYAVPEGNQRTMELAEKFRDVIKPLWVLPQHSALDIEDPDSYVAEMIASGVRAVRVQAAPYHGYLVDEWALGPTWRVLEEARVPVLIAGSDLGRSPDGPAKGFSAKNIYDVCQTYPNLPVIVLRLNFSALRVAGALLAQCPNLHMEISYFTSHRGVEVLAARVGADRLLFGSGLPWSPPGPAIAAISYSALSDQQKALVAGDNLQVLLEGVRR